MEQPSRRSRTSASTSLGRASAFLVHRPRHPTGSANGSRAPSQLRVIRPSLSPSMAAAAATAVGVGNVGPSPHTGEDASRLPLDLLEPAAARWASAAGRASRASPRVRNTLDPRSDVVVDTGVFVCPDTVVAALYTAASGREDLVVTAECGGWLRVREQRTGVIRHQQRLRDGNEASCLAWAAGRAVPALRTVAVVGQLSGLISFYGLVGESLVELAPATCVFHEAPILACVPLHTPATLDADGETPVAALPGQSCLLSVDADGVVALWSLEVNERGRSGGAAALSVELQHCSYAVSPASRQRRFAKGRKGGGEEQERSSDGAGSCGGAGVVPSLPSASTPPVVVSAAPLVDVVASPCAVFSTHRFADHPALSEGERGEESDEDSTAASEDGDDHLFALIYLSDFVRSVDEATGPDLDGTTLAMSTYLSDTVVSASTDGAAPPRAQPGPPPRYGWEVLCTYSLPEDLRTRPENRAVSIVSLCLVGGGGDGDAAAASAQLWAGTADGRLLIWQAHTELFLRCLHSTTAAPIHDLVCVPASGFDGARRRGGGDPLVWASQADGSVVAWSAVTFAVVEVLPISYPPPPQLTAPSVAEEEAVVTVRDAVDLLRATRHRQPSNGLSLPSPTAAAARGCGFTLFVQPMEVVCMQRAWSVATDGTVRTWLLPAGAAPPPLLDDEDDVRQEDVAKEKNEVRRRRRPQRQRRHAGAPRDGVSVEEDEEEPLDPYTVQCFLQDKAEACVRERQAQRLEWAAQQAQLSALRERNEVLAAALQQAIGRLERVSADGLVRSTSPADGRTSPRQQQQHPSRDALKTPDVRDAISREDSSGDSDGDRSRSFTERGEGSKGAEERDQQGGHARPSSWQSEASSLDFPSTDAAPRDQLVATTAVVETSHSSPDETLTHVRVLQQLLEELHSQLKESWSRNDALREELLIYQLRTLEREEDMARRVRETVMQESAMAAAPVQVSNQEDAGWTSTSSALPSPPLRPGSASASSETRRRSPNDAAAPPSPLTTTTFTATAPISRLNAASRLASPSRVVEAPAVDLLVGSAPQTSQRDQNSPLRYIQAPLPTAQDDVASSDYSVEDVTELDATAGEALPPSSPPTLVAAWSTSETVGLSPFSSSVITAFSHDRSATIGRNAPPLPAAQPMRVYAANAWTPPEQRGASTHTRPLPTGRVTPPPPLRQQQQQQQEHATVPPVSSQLRTFHSPIIYRY